MSLIKSRKKRLTLIVLITAFWLVMNAELVRREAWLPRLPSGSTSIAASLSPDISFKEQWMGIYFADQKVGYSNTTVNRRPSSAPGYLILNRTFMVVEMMNTPLKVQFEGLLNTDPDFRMRNFTSTLISAGHRIQIDGELEGDTLSLSVLSGSKVFRKEMKVSEDLNLSNSLTPLLFLPDLEPGKTYTIDILNPLSFTTDKAKVTARGIEPYEYEGKQIDAYVVDTEYQGITFTAWVTETGEVLKESTPLGWTLLREDRDVAVDFRAEVAEFKHDIARILSVPSDMRIEEPEKTRALETQLSGIDFSLFRLEGAGQRIVDAKTGLIRIDMKRPDAAESLPIPISDQALAEHLRPTLLIQSDDAGIRTLAAKIAGDERNSLIVAERINQWVFDNIQKQITFSLPSAVEVLESRQGDCNEHTALYAALARAAGIPTKVAIGIVYYRGSFYYHAWPEVYVGEWVAMDPTFGQPLADATHIKLLEGELDQQAKLMQILGKIKVSIRSISYEPPSGKDAPEPLTREDARA
jgi:hypothetical protein